MENVKLSRLDAQIIRCLHRDARTPAAKIASQLRIPESTVHYRLNRLIERNIIEFAVLTNPLQYGYRIWAMIQIQAELPKVRSVAQRLAIAPEVYFVGIMAGAYDIHAAAIFRSNEELLDFITGRLSKIPGIIHTSTSSILELVKRSWSFTFPEAIVKNEHPSRKGGVGGRKSRTHKGSL